MPNNDWGTQRKPASEAVTAETQVITVQTLDAAGKVTPAGDDPARAIYVQGAGSVVPGALMSFGNPAAVPPHSTGLAGNVLPAAAQGAAVACAAPAAGKAWSQLQIFIRFATTVQGADFIPDATVKLYWGDATNWYRMGDWLAKYIAAAAQQKDKREFSDYTTLPFPARATRFAVGVEDYAANTFFVDLQPTA